MRTFVMFIFVMVGRICFSQNVAGGTYELEGVKLQLPVGVQLKVIEGGKEIHHKRIIFGGDTIEIFHWQTNLVRMISRLDYFIMGSGECKFYRDPYLYGWPDFKYHTDSMQIPDPVSELKIVELQAEQFEANARRHIAIIDSAIAKHIREMDFQRALYSQISRALRRHEQSKYCEAKLNRRKLELSIERKNVELKTADGYMEKFDFGMSLEANVRNKATMDLIIYLIENAEVRAK